MRWRDVVVPGTIALVTSAALARGTRRIVRDFFPLADEWAILAHSHPTVADPRSWFSNGFRGYFAPPPGLPDPQGDKFSRPLFNATYWLVGKLVEPTSGRYLHVGHVGVGAAAGLTAAGILRSGGSVRAAAGSGAAVPFMPALVPSASLLVYPCMAYDPVAACLSQSATIAYDAGRYRTAAGFLVAGVLTKETALPSAAALPALFAVENRGRLLRDGRSRRSLAALVAPAATWYAARRAAYGDVGLQESAYVLREDPQGRLVRQARIAAKLPFWTNLAALRSPGRSPEKVGAAAHLVANALVIGGAALKVGARLRAGKRLSADEVSFAMSYAFLNAVGTSPRYGVSLDLSLLTSLARWRREGGSTPAVRAVTAGLAVGAAASTVLVARDYPRLERNFLAYAEVGRRYVAALRQFGPGDRVLVLNDPVTFWAPVKWLARTLGIRASVVKLADHPWSYDNLAGMATPSVVDLQPPAEPGGQWRFTQSEGIDILAAYPALSAHEPAHVDYGDGVAIDLEPFPDGQQTGDHQRWAAMRISPGTGPAHLLYYDPADGEFHAVALG